MLKKKTDNLKNVIVTGAGGFIGSHLVESLTNSGHNVYAIVKSNSRRDFGWINFFNKEIRQKLKIVIADITKPILFKEFVTEPIDIVYHLASVTDSENAFKKPAQFYKVNFLGTLNILEMCRVKGINRIIFISSYVYGIPKYLPIDEEHPVEPVNPYTGSKLLSEKLIKQYNHYFGLNCVILRPFNIYGEREGAHLLIPKLMKQVFSKKIVLRDPEPKRDFLYISDMIDALIKAGRYEKEGVNIFNIGSGKSYSVEEIVNMIVNLYQNKYNKKVKVNYLGIKRKNEVADIVADIKKSKKELDWYPKIDIKEGIKKTFEWYESNE